MTPTFTGADFWNERYGNKEYMYGDQPNDFLREHLELFKSGDHVLSLAEGEGRNGVFLAQHGCKVHGVDFSASGQEKALKLAEAKGVKIAYELADLTKYDMGENKWDGIISIFCHLHIDYRPAIFQSIKKALKPGGILLLESYNQDQLQYKTGGPSDINFLPTLEELKQAFSDTNVLLAENTLRHIQEGPHHQGLSSVTRIIAKKPV